VVSTKMSRLRYWGKSGRGLPQSKTLARFMMTPDNAKRLGVRQPSGALTRRLVALKQCESGSLAETAADEVRDRPW
jgi:hypothetical protein